ncbi:hypothetical protein [uncultured Lamprocystis sp.]|jgi:predicted nucleic acid-binding protein|uniref:hypothetical protein n=1 Tax=uncultured Lamprocystis sp. TaxID=543132 RepID=UPI0025ECAEA0|nr:hypothetical protein [uncultured Lamprocystis sp.]
MSTEVFLDTAYAIALSSGKDQFHVRAIALAEQMEAARTRLVTTRAALFISDSSLADHRAAAPRDKDQHVMYYV